MMKYTCNPITQEAESGGVQVQDWATWQDPVSKKKKKKKRKEKESWNGGWYSGSNGRVPA
jgi:hypothetical protein